MNAKQMKALRKNQHELLLELQGQLGDDAFRRLKDHLSSVLQLVKDSNTTTEERLLAENESLKSQLAEKEEHHRTELTRVKHTCSEELATRLSAIEAKYQKKTADMEAKVASFEHINAMVGKQMLQLNEIACTMKAVQVAQGRFGPNAGPELFFLAINAAAQCADNGKAARLMGAGFDVAPYLTDKGWNVFICCKGEMGTTPKLLTVREHEIKRALN